MGITLARIEEALRIEDVEGFIALGAPDDEYRSEAEQIAASLAQMDASKLTRDTIVTIIALVWAKSFNRSAQEITLRVPAFQRIAQSL